MAISGLPGKAAVPERVGVPNYKSVPLKRARDLRVDFFRGLALFMIFADHIPNNILSNFTLHTFGFSDAAAMFIFISGYAAAMVYGRALQTGGVLAATAKIFRRVWQLYVAHIFLFVIYMAEVSYTVKTFNNPMYNEELGVADFLQEPHIAIIKALILQFQPAFLDILPLYIVLLSSFILVLLALRRHWLWAVIPSLSLYAATFYFGLHIAAYPDHRPWFFNPFAWQVLFVLGATFGYVEINRRPLLVLRRWMGIAAGVLLVAAAVVRGSWAVHAYYDSFPPLLLRSVGPLLDKQNMSPLILAHFLCLALVITLLTRRDAAFLTWPVLRPIVRCGQHSLHIFCLGILLSLIGHFVLTEFGSTLDVQFGVNAFGIAVMLITGTLLSWYKRIEQSPGPSHGAAPTPGSSG